MQIRWLQTANKPGHASHRWNRKNSGLARMVGAVMANAKHGTVEREHMVIVITIGKVGLNESAIFFLKVEPVQTSSIFGATAAVKNQSLAIPRPVRRFEWLH